MQTEAPTTLPTADPSIEPPAAGRGSDGAGPTLVVTGGGRSPRAEVLRGWAREAPGPLALAMRRRACELDLLAAVGVAVPRAA